MLRIASRLLLLTASIGTLYLGAAPADRITRPVNTSQTRALRGSVPALAQSRFDRGAVDPGMRLNHVVLVFQPSAAQQAELNQLLADQQNPSSPLFHKWLTPEEFGARFGVSGADRTKVTGWLRSAGFSIDENARAANWVAFSGTAGQVAKSFGTSLHRFMMNGEPHFANASEISVPDALAGVTAGFLGLNDFRLMSFARPVTPDYTVGSSHYLAPEDFSTIYDLKPLYQAGLDGTGQSIAIVGDSNVLLTDMRAFRTRYNLPANDPKIVSYTGSDSGFNADQVEGNLDLEWAGAIAPKSTLYYIYGPNVLTAIASAIDMNAAPVLSISYGGCEIDFSPPFFRSLMQQANAQGITVVNSSGDSGAAGCDQQGSEPFATRGRMVDFPAVLPEVTGVGGTEFVEAGGNYWAAVNSPNYGSALSYIPEAAWNESSIAGLGASGGGASVLYAKPGWQTGPGVPDDNARHVPDVALSAAGHDAYLITYMGLLTAVAGTSASAPSLAGILALLNQYQVNNGLQQAPGLGNINPQLYRLAQSVPAAFHPVTNGNNIVPCAQGSPDCLEGSFGYSAGAGYNMAAGLGSVDANVLVTQWNTQVNAVMLTLSAASQATINDTLTASVVITGGSGSGTPTGTVDFSINNIALGSAPVTANSGQATATLSFPVYQLGAGKFTLTAAYSGDAAFASAGATQTIQVTTPTKVSAIVPSGPNTVWAAADAQGLGWQTKLSLREAAGVAAVLTSFAIDGTEQRLSQYFPSPEIAAHGTVTTSAVLRNLTTPSVHTFNFSGVDAAGQNWSRQISVTYLSMPENPDFLLTATPLTVTPDNAPDASCQWSVNLHVDELGGFARTISALYAGTTDLSSQIAAVFGTPRLQAWDSLQGILCLDSVTPPASEYIEVDLASGVAQEVLVSFAPPPPNPAKLSAMPAAITLTSPSGSEPAQAKFSVGSDAAQSWMASVFPANRTTQWLSVSQLAGTGPAQISLTASGADFEPGVYRASIVIQAVNAAPVTVPVMFVLGASSSGPAINAIANPATYQPTAAPGMVLSIFGTNLANGNATPTSNPRPYSAAGVSATVNGFAAPILYASPTQLNIQVPYEAGAGPAVLGINTNGQIAGFAFQIAPAAPGIFADANGSLTPAASAAQGGTVTMYVTGVGEVSPLLKTAYAPTATSTNLPQPVLPFSVTVGGVPAFLQSAVITPGQVGVIQVNFIVPSSIIPGPQPVMVTVNGVSSPPVNFTVTE